VGIALGILLLVLGYDSSIRQTSEAVARDNNETLEELEDTVKKFLGHEGVAERRNNILRKEFFPGVKAKLEFPDTLPQAPIDLDPAVHLRKELKRIQDDTRNRAARKDMAQPEYNWDIGNKIKKNNTPQEVAELRLRLSATSSVVDKCIESNMKQIRKIRQGKTVIEVVEDTPTVIRRLPFTVEVEGDLYSITAVLLAFQKEGNFLETMDCLVAETSKPGILSAKIELAALRMLDRSQVKGEAGVEIPAQRESSGSRPAGRRTRRKRY
jgi:hypothetical protein